MATDESSIETAFAVPPPDPELRRLEPLVGSWAAEDQSKSTPLAGPDVPVRNEESFRWLDGGYFLLSTYHTVFGDEPAQTGVNYWYYDSSDRKFRIIFFSNNGPFTEEGNRYEGEVAEGKLTFEGPARFQYGLDHDGRSRSTPMDLFRLPGGCVDENGAWEPWMNNTFRKTSDSG
jgi:Protein of unknown function (DUF1579)